MVASKRAESGPPTNGNDLTSFVGQRIVEGGGMEERRCAGELTAPSLTHPWQDARRVRAFFSKEDSGEGRRMCAFPAPYAKGGFRTGRIEVSACRARSSCSPRR